MRSTIGLVARILGALLGAATGLVAVQLMRLRRMEFLPGHPGFYVNHVVRPPVEVPGASVLRLAVFGDSTTSGVGVDRAEDSLPHLLAERIARAHRRPVHVVSYGWSGARVGDLPSAQLPRAMRPLRATETEPFLPRTEVIAVVVGANDATHRTPRARFRQQLRDTLAQIGDAAPDAEVVLAGIPPLRGALPEMEPLIFLAEQWARVLRAVARDEAAQAGVRYADLAVELPRRIRGRGDVLASDRFHPSAEGYRAWAGVIGDALFGDQTEAAARHA